MTRYESATLDALLKLDEAREALDNLARAADLALDEPPSPASAHASPPSP
jgi:hypothetical protein